MGGCDRWGSLVDSELHRFGLCLCALYPASRPARLPWERADIARLLGLMGFALHENQDGTFYAHDPARQIYNPHNPDHGVAYAKLGELVIAVVCANSLHGPMTEAQARERLATWGLTLSGYMHPVWGWEWVVYHAPSDHRSEGGFNLPHVLQMAESYLRYLGHEGSYQPVLEDVVQQAPRPKLRPEQLRASARPKLDLGVTVGRVTRRAARPAAQGVEGQIGLDLFAGGGGVEAGEPPSRDGGGGW